jgi:hypothetical protein
LLQFGLAVELIGWKATGCRDCDKAGQLRPYW